MEPLARTEVVRRTSLRAPLSDGETQSVIEYRRRLYHSLWEKAHNEGLLDVFSCPITQNVAESLYSIDASSKDIFTSLLKLLCRVGALRTYFDDTGQRVYVHTGVDRTQVPLASDVTRALSFDTLTSQSTELNVTDATGQLALYQASQLPSMIFSALKDPDIRVHFSQPFEQWWRAALEAKFYASGRDMASQSIAAPGLTVLDLASGLGHGLQTLIETVGPAGKVIGVEVSPHHLAVSRSLSEKYENVTIHEADLNSGLPMIDDKSVDGVMITGAFHFILKKEFLLSEIDRVTKPGSGLVIGNCFMDVDVFDREYLDLFFSVIKPVARPIRPDVLKLLMEDHGFDIYFDYLVGAFGWYFSQKKVD